MKKILFLYCLLLAVVCNANAQNQLKAVSEPSLLSDIKINSTTILTEDEGQLVVSISCKVNNGKAHAVQGKILDNNQKEIINFESSTEEVPEDGGTVDLTIKFRPGENFRYNNPLLKTHFIELTFASLEEEGSIGNLIKSLGNDGKLGKLFNNSFTYELKKDWRVPGNPAMVINVPITPIGKAKDIVTKTTPVIIRPNTKIQKRYFTATTVNKYYLPISKTSYGKISTKKPTSSAKKKPTNSKTNKSSRYRTPNSKAKASRPTTTLKMMPILATTATPTSKPKTDKSSKGPTNKQFIVTDNILSDIDFSEDNLFSIDELVFRDFNLNAGYYYYYPAKYSLKWNAARKGDKYDLNFNFGSSGKVTVTAILDPKISREDKGILQALLKNDINKTEERPYGVKKFTPLPLTGAPEIAFSGLSQFGINEENVSVSAPSKLDDPIKMTFTTENINDLTNMLFNDIGLYGKVIIHPDGEEMMNDIEIPFSLKIDDPETYGKFVLTPGEWRKGWQNPTDYPIVLSYMHALVKVKGEYQVYSWDLQDTEVPEHARVRFKNSKDIPSWIDKNTTVQQIWLEYATEACNSCNAKLIEEFIKGYVPVEEKKIRIRVQNALEFTEADVIYLTLRSYQAEAAGRTNKEFEVIEIASDGKTIMEGPLFVREGSSMDYEYKIEVVMPDGEVHESPNWIKHDKSVLPIGAALIKKQVPFFKAKAVPKDGGVPRRRN